MYYMYLLLVMFLFLGFLNKFLNSWILVLFTATNCLENLLNRHTDKISCKQLCLFLLSSHGKLLVPIFLLLES